MAPAQARMASSSTDTVRDGREPAADLTHGTETMQLLEDIGVDETAFEQGGGGGNGTEAVDHDIGLGPGFEGA